MTKTFLESKGIEIKKGYLSVAGKDMNPVSNDEFIKAQLHAEYIIAFAKEAKGKDFKGSEPVSLEAIKLKVTKALNDKSVVNFVSKPAKVALPTQNKLAKEALSFMKFTEETSKVDKINAFLTKFEVIAEFEGFEDEETGEVLAGGLFFIPGIVKLNKIYTMKEIIKAVTEVIELVD